ncbi:MAG TPA: class I SAM-dependent methyltransferase [Chitinophagaceae bacterium]|nr:class I SAM-dependent methyltransferase [Chitinophagaceae bacterium]
MDNKTSAEENVLKNEQFYNNLYATVNIDDILKKLSNFNGYLDFATKTYTSWAGFYKNDFKNQIAGKKVLELGCGDCLNAAVMAALGAEIVANDISSQPGRIILELNKQYPFKYPIQYIYGDFLKADLHADSFDIISGKNFVHHLTPELEVEFTRKIVRLLKPGGFVRYFEPAQNSKFLDYIRWMIPVPGRPSKLQKKKFAKWKAADPHPDRDNSYRSYLKIGKMFFEETEILPIGSLERFNRIIPQGKFNLKFRQFAFKAEKLIPRKLDILIARSQTITYKKPKKNMA